MPTINDFATVKPDMPMALSSFAVSGLKRDRDTDQNSTVPLSHKRESSRAPDSSKNAIFNELLVMHLGWQRHGT